MGGKDSQNGGGVMENSFKTTQLLDGGGYESGFDLTIPSFYSCSIDDPASGHVIITGGVINDQGAHTEQSTQSCTGIREHKDHEPRGGGNEQEGVVMSHGSRSTEQP